MHSDTESRMIYDRELSTAEFRTGRASAITNRLISRTTSHSDLSELSTECSVTGIMRVLSGVRISGLRFEINSRLRATRLTCEWFWRRVDEKEENLVEEEKRTWGFWVSRRT